MALTTNELFSSAAGRGSQERVIPTVVRPKKFAAGAGTLERLTMAAYDTVTLTWKPWTNGGANGTGVLKGLVWPDEITLDAAGEVLGQVLIRGSVHRDDIPLNGELQADVDAELASGARDIGIDVEGIEGVR